MRALAVLALVSLSFAACGDITVKSIRVADSVPATLEGEWTGQWSSTRSTGGGTVRLRMQDFEGEPVVSVQLDNPCIEARAYQFRTTGNLIELLADGVPLFSAVLGEARTLTGTYECAADSGVWSVTWSRELAPLVDLGGRWDGTLSLPGLSTTSLRLQLDLDFLVQGGALVVQGTARLPDLSTTVLPVFGVVFFRTDDFDLRLLAPTTETGTGIELFGVGPLDTRRIDTGLVQVTDPSLPIAQATWQAQWISP